MMPNPLAREADRQLALFVGGGVDALAHVEPILAGRAYDVEFVDADDEPYATIAALKPDIVVVSLNMGSEASFQLLTMLRLDPETAEIPVLSYVQEDEIDTEGTTSVGRAIARLNAAQASRVQRH